MGTYRAERDGPRFTWSDLGDIAEGRPNLGPDCPVLVHRLLELTLRDTLTGRYGADETSSILREAGTVAGAESCRSVLDASLPVTGEMVCDYDEGFIAGVLHAYSRREFVAREVDCWASGGRICRFAVRPLTAELDAA